MRERRDGPVGVAGVDVSGGLAADWRLAGERGEEHRAQAIDVAGLYTAAAKGFGREEFDGLGPRPRVLHVELGDVPEQTKIAEQHVPALEEEDVGGFEVAM